MGAESRYSPVEGEALAVAWGMWKAKYFLLGAKDLYVVVDHKPLLGLYRPDQQLSEVENPGLLNIVEKTTRFQFKILHVPSKTNLSGRCALEVTSGIHETRNQW